LEEGWLKDLKMKVSEFHGFPTEGYVAKLKEKVVTDSEDEEDSMDKASVIREKELAKFNAEEKELRAALEAQIAAVQDLKDKKTLVLADTDSKLALAKGDLEDARANSPTSSS